MDFATLSPDPSVLYAKILDDLNILTTKLAATDDDDDDDNDKSEDGNEADPESQLNEFKQKVCGVHSGDDANAPHSNLSRMYADLSETKQPAVVVERIAKLIAELAKEELCRARLVERDFFVPLNRLLVRPDASDVLKTQVCRAIGNLCYYNDVGRLKLLNSCGLSAFLELCKYCARLDFANASDKERAEKNTLITVTLGCLHNITNENETLKKVVYEAKIMGILKKFAPFLGHSRGILVYFGSCLENLVDTDEGKAQFLEEQMALELYEWLDEHVLANLGEYSEDFFANLSDLNELEKSKEYLCQTKFLDTLIKSIERRLDDESFLRPACLFIVNLLLKDDVERIFEYRSGLLINKAIQWLAEFKNDQLYVASAVIIANYMRTDENSLKMIRHEKQPHALIINILSKLHSNEPSLQQINVVHSLLGALRNFCVAVSTRDELLKEQRVIEVALAYLDYDNAEVNFKALGIVRLLVKSCTDKNGALALVFSSGALQKIERLALNPPGDHPGVAGESSRLCAYLPLAAKSEKNVALFCSFDMIGVVCAQLRSEHLIMVNEALLAVNVLATINYRASKDKLRAGDLTECLKLLLNRDPMPVEMQMNTLKLFKILLDKNDFFTEAEIVEFVEVFKKSKLNEGAELVKSQLHKLVAMLEDMIL